MEQVVHVVRDAAGELADGLHLLRLDQLEGALLHLALQLGVEGGHGVGRRAPLGHVQGDPDEARRLPVRVRLGPAAPGDPTHAAVRQGDAVLRFDPLAGLRRPLRHGVGLLAIVRVEEGGPLEIGQAQAVGRLAVQEGGFRRPVDGARLHVPIPGAHARRFDRDLEPLPVRLQVPLGPPTARDVGAARDHMGQPPVLVAQRGELEVDGPDLALGQPHVVLEPDQGPGGGVRHRPLKPRPDRGIVVPPAAVPEPPVADVAESDAGAVERGPVDLHDRAVGIEHAHEGEQAVQHAAQPRFALAQPLLGGAALRDVLHDRDEVVRPPLGVAHQGAGEVHPEDARVLADIALLHAVGFDAAVQQGVHLVEVGPQVVGVGDVLERPAEQLFGGVSDNVGQLFVDAQKRPVQPHMRQANGRLLESRAEPLLAFRKRRLCACTVFFFVLDHSQGSGTHQ